METQAEPAVRTRDGRNSNRKKPKCLAFIFFMVFASALTIYLCPPVVFISASAFVIPHEASSPSLGSLGHTTVHVPATEKDVCLKKNSNHARSECFQPLLEAFYGRRITDLCQNLGLLLSEAECRVCPWDMVSPSSNLSLAVFHEAGEECSIANHVKVYAKWQKLYGTYHQPSLGVDIIVFLLSLYGYSAEGRISVLAYTVPEAVYLGIYWIVFDLCVVLWARFRDFRIYCQPWADAVADVPTITILYAAVLCVSISRCLKLRSIQYSKVVLETVSVVIYALGPQKNAFRRKVRSWTLVVISLSCHFVFFLNFTDWYKPRTRRQIDTNSPS